MIFTVNISGQDVTMSNSIEWMFNYKKQWPKDDPMKWLMEAMKLANKPGDSGIYDALGYIGLRIPDMAWAMARVVDKSLPAPNAWVKQFAEFPILDIGQELLIRATEGMSTTTELKNAETPETARTPAN